MGFRVPEKLLQSISLTMWRREIPMPDGSPYLARLYKGKSKADLDRRGTKNFGWFLHQYLAADSERWLHDHPFKWSFSIVLRGGYIEEVLDYFDVGEANDAYPATKLKKVRFFNIITKRKFHRIVSVEPGTWTLFFHGKRMKRWGFLMRAKDQTVRYVYWRKALDVWD